MAWIASDVVNEPGRTVTSSVSSEQGSPANPIRYAQSEVKSVGLDGVDSGSEHAAEGIVAVVAIESRTDKIVKFAVD